MKVLIRRLPVILFLVISTPVALFAQEDEYYVTIGVFAVHNNAIRFTAKANKAGFNAQYAINPKRNLYYVYLLESTDRRKAVSFMMKVRAESDYKDAWIFFGRLGTDAPAEVKTTPAPTPAEKTEVTPVVVAPIVVEETKTETAPVAPAPAKADSVVAAKPPVKRVVKGKLFTFKFINADNGNEIRGEIHFSESKKATQYQAFKADEAIDLLAPKNPAGIYYITTIAPGYKPITTQFNYKDPVPVSSGTGPEGELIIPLSLERAKRGDYIEFTNVSFYRNSVVLHPQSEIELLGLADLMKEHKDYKVKVHGHCNGTESRDIITLGTSTKFFASDPGNQKKRASDKELTTLRAEAVKSYLVSQGVEADRISVKGEGGKLMIYPQNSVYANYNDRVEVEITRH
ncbi:MAG: OmpA family protein [Cyclobacteriaceae bacterium]|nr:OmpA family protein [Cyclobacteriaceae bacterium]